MTSELRIRQKRDKGQFWVDGRVIDEYGPKLGVYGIGVYIALCYHAGPEHADRWTTVTVLAAELTCSKAKVRESLEMLEQLGLVERGRAYDCELSGGGPKEYCELCGMAYFALDRHHIVPKSEGGSDEAANVAYLCPNCHRTFHAVRYRLVDCP